MPDLNMLLANPDMTAWDLLSQAPYSQSGMFGSTAPATTARMPPSALAGLGDTRSQGRGGFDFSGMFGNVQTLMGAQKWSGGGNSIDVFTPRDATVYAPFDGVVQTMNTMLGPVPGQLVMLTDPQTGFSMRLVHTQPLAQGGQVRKGQPLARVNDPGMDQLRWPGGQYGNAPGGYQHAQVDFANSPGGFSDGPMGGQLDARSILMGGGFRPTQQVARTPGPPEGQGGGMGMGGPMGMMGGLPGMPGMGGPMGGMGGGMFGGGMPGMGGGPMGGMMGGLPGLGGMGGGMGMGMPPMMGGGPMGMFGGLGMGGGGFGGGMGLPGMPPMFGGFGQFGMQQGLLPGSQGVGGGIYGGGPMGALGPVTSNPGSFSGPMPNPFSGMGHIPNPLMALGPLMSGMGGFGF